MGSMIELLSQPGARFIARTLVHLLLASVLTAPLAFFVLHRYRRAIEQWMRVGRPAPPPLPPALPRQEAPLACRFADVLEPVALSPEAAATALAARREVRNAAMVYGIAGLLHAAATTALIARAIQIHFVATTLLALFFVLAWPTSLIVGRIALASRRVRSSVPAGLTALAVLFAGAPHLSLMWTMWQLYVLLPLVLMLAVAHRRIRTVGLLLFPSVLLVASAVRHAQMSGPPWPGLKALVAGALALGAVLGLLRWLGRLAERNRLSDLDLTLGMQWLLLTLWQAFCMAVATGRFSAVTLLPFLIYIVAVGVGRQATRMHEPRNRKLLLLRTFGARARSERLLDEIGVHWRRLGSLQLIGAPDVAAANLDPHEFLALATGRLRSLFVEDETDLDRRLAELQFERGPDGRFAVNELYCFAHIWREAVIRLADDTAVVLMDLRAFTTERAGCVEELRLLIDRVPFSRIVFLTDETTQREYLCRVLQSLWHERSPHSPNHDAVGVGMLHISSSRPRAVRRLLDRLCAAATDAQPVAAP